MAESLGLEEDETLIFANAEGACYISQKERTYATLDDVMRFLRERRHKLTLLPKIIGS